ncbi:uncharacterized protein LOC128260995 [Drosophila gunungcola]|uniref:uncharacterized protein LOC128260995 n=1 Tax=Drosophila gunungcola TaxID=103775 RepID=UPI0022DEEAC4|nr:uncharacterized protein LOC128260995 [Drosophila gunungcola]
MFNNYGWIFNRKCHCGPQTENFTHMSNTHLVKNHGILVSRKCTGNTQTKVSRLNMLNNHGTLIWHKCSCNSELFIVNQLYNFGTIINCMCNCSRTIPSPSLYMGIENSSTLEIAGRKTTPPLVTTVQLGGSNGTNHDIRNLGRPRNSNLLTTERLGGSARISLLKLLGSPTSGVELTQTGAAQDSCPELDCKSKKIAIGGNLKGSQKDTSNQENSFLPSPKTSRTSQGFILSKGKFVSRFTSTPLPVETLAGLRKRTADPCSSQATLHGQPKRQKSESSWKPLENRNNIKKSILLPKPESTNQQQTTITRPTVLLEKSVKMESPIKTINPQLSVVSSYYKPAKLQNWLLPKPQHPRSVLKPSIYFKNAITVLQHKS